MALSAELGKANIEADIATKAAIELKQQDGGFAITSSHLDVTVTAKGADRGAVENATKTAKANCPVSKLLKAEITMDAKYEV